MSVKSSALNVERSSGEQAAPANLLAKLDYSVLQQCMHCGMCLPTCPTYAETNLERHSPRGRIALMRAIADGELEVSKSFGEEMYYCLGCLACTTACPAGVNYAELFETARVEVERQGVLDSPKRDFIRWFALRFIFTRPRLLRFVGRLIWLWQVSGLQGFFRRTGLIKLVPGRLGELEPQTPVIRAKFSHQLIASVEPARGTKRHRVAVLTGCVQDLIFSEINRATVDVLVENGCEVLTPPVQPCCGSLHAHNGDLTAARDLARRQLDLIDPAQFDAIISNAGGCGSHLRHYDHLLADDPAYAERAKVWSRKLKDVHEWLVEIGFRKPKAPEERSTFNAQSLTLNEQSAGGAEGSTSAINVKRSALSVDDKSAPTALTYHESCHLCHGQKVSGPPREILRALPGFELRECAEATWCCGSAGIYNITQPETAARLQQRKTAHLQATGATIVATANPGCHLQIENGLKQAGDSTTVVLHPVVLLARAYAAES